MSMNEALRAIQAGLEARFPDREVWWVTETTFPGTGMRVSWHSKPRGAACSDVHGDTPEHLAEHIVMAEEDARTDGMVSYDSGEVPQ